MVTLWTHWRLLKRQTTICKQFRVPNFPQCRSLYCGRKLEDMERTHTGTNSTQKRAQGCGMEPTTFLLWGNNARHCTNPACRAALNSDCPTWCFASFAFLQRLRQNQLLRISSDSTPMSVTTSPARCSFYSRCGFIRALVSRIIIKKKGKKLWNWGWDLSFILESILTDTS